MMTMKELELRFAKQLLSVGFECGPGWAGLLQEMFDAVEAAQAKGDAPADFTWLQIKEKWGGLRMYHPPTSALHDLADDIEERSHQICDQCGAPGALVNDGWVKTRCDAHRTD